MKPESHVSTNASSKQLLMLKISLNLLSSSMIGHSSGYAVPFISSDEDPLQIFEIWGIS